MNPESINSVIDHLAEKLAVPTGQLMAMLPRLGYKDLYALITVIIFFGVSVALCAVFVNIAIKNCNESIWILPVSITGVVALTALAIFLIEFPNILFWLHDPQAWAFDYVLKMLH